MYLWQIKIILKSGINWINWVNYHISLPWITCGHEWRWFPCKNPWIPVEVPPLATQHLRSWGPPPSEVLRDPGARGAPRSWERSPHGTHWYTLSKQYDIKIWWYTISYYIILLLWANHRMIYPILREDIPHVCGFYCEIMLHLGSAWSADHRNNRRPIFISMTNVGDQPQNRSVQTVGWNTNLRLLEERERERERYLYYIYIYIRFRANK